MSAHLKAAPAIRRPYAIAGRVQALDWQQPSQDLDVRGCATIEGLLSPAECAALSGLYARDELFRSRVVMVRHATGGQKLAFQSRGILC